MLPKAASGRPLIAIPSASVASTLPEEPTFWAMRSSYATVLLNAGATPIFLSQVTSLDQLSGVLSHIGGILLAGGADIDPNHYHADAEPNLEETDPQRDQTELLLLTWAFENKIPLLGICRGMQMINVARGGTLLQDIPTDVPVPISHRHAPLAYANLAHHGHLVTITPKTKLAAVVGYSEVWVNSMHHQGIRRLGEGLIANAQSADGLIEGIEGKDPDHWLIGVQSHPEVMTNEHPWTNKLFDQFIHAADRHTRRSDEV